MGLGARALARYRSAGALVEHLTASECQAMGGPGVNDRSWQILLQKSVEMGREP